MKIKRKNPDPFFYEGVQKDIAILLIHGFTGSPAEMRPLGKFLNDHNYAVYGPLLAGHGKSPEEMAETNKEDWWGSVVEAYDWLKKKGYKNIIAVGLSMGGVLSLKLAIERELQAVIPLAAPIFVRDKRIALVRWVKYFKAYQIKQKKNDELEQHLASYDRTPLVCVESLHKLIKEVRKRILEIKIPILVMQGKKDETVVPESAQYIYNHVQSTHKEIKWYENSSHIMTIDREKDQIYVDILGFLEKINNIK